ncbi:MAG: DUF6048 family protein [Bergeyella sp.]
MKKNHICTLFFSFFFCFALGQQKSDTIVSPKKKYSPNFMVGFDVLNTGVSFFSDRKLYQGFVSTQVKPNLHAVLEAGFEKNIYQKNNYDAEAGGAFLKLGAFYMLAHDRENPQNGFYAGGKIAGSMYNQEYFKVPVRGFEGGDYTEAFPESNQSSFWLEGTIGGRVQLFESPFYIDVTAQPRYMIFTSKQEDIVPMIVPGFGKSSTKFNVGFTWSIAYSF